MNSETLSTYLNNLNHVAIFGANGAIGSELISQLTQVRSINTITVFSKK